MNHDPSPVVWSSAGAAQPPDPRASPASKKPAAPIVPARVRIERQGRGGKVVTVIDQLTGHPARIDEIAKTLKSKCGAGGTVKGRVVEIQGDHRDRVVDTLMAMGIPAKRSGG